MSARNAMRRAAAVALAAALAAAVAGCGASAGKEAAARGPDVAVLAASDLAKVGRADLATGVLVQGTLQPARDVNLAAPFPEVLDEVTVKEGQAVAAGQVLARFRATSIAPAAAGAEAARRVAAADYARMQSLFQEGAVSQRDLDGAEAQLRAAEAQAALAGKRLGEASVRAPFAGVVARRYVQGGDRVSDGDPLFRVVNTDELEFSASVPTEAMAGVRPGAKVALTVSGLDGAVVAGRVSRVNATVDPATRQVKIYVTVPNRDHRLAGDMFATGRVVVREARNAVALPAGAAQTAGGATYAWVVAGGKLEKRPVTIGLRDELAELVEVKSGLAGGETVVVSPMEDLTPGQPVQVGGGGK
jgi:RND family efflux transporter MFP subunit